MAHHRAISLPAPASPGLGAAFRDLVLPREHGSWSLAFEPLLLGLLVAPSAAGGWFALAVAAAFFARRPLNIATRDHRAARRAAAWRAAAACVGVAAACFAAAVALAGTAWTAWLLPSVAAGAVFLAFDLRCAGREQAAEIAGTAAFGFLPAVFAVLAGWSPMPALALGLIMVGRAVPTVLCVRATLRAAKTGRHQRALPIAAAFAAVALGCALVRAGLAPWGAAALLGLLAARALALLGWRGGPLRARTLGMIELGAGLMFVFGVAAAWRLA